MRELSQGESPGSLTETINCSSVPAISCGISTTDRIELRTDGPRTPPPSPASESDPGDLDSNGIESDDSDGQWEAEEDSSGSSTEFTFRRVNTRPTTTKRSLLAKMRLGRGGENPSGEPKSVDAHMQASTLRIVCHKLSMVILSEDIRVERSHKDLTFNAARHRTTLDPSNSQRCGEEAYNYAAF
ncbi:hypothetical protein AOQ84DRAFT_377249 [Glonium stellatum]|uniref:DUF3295 domain-containing protein n=1 Tax=Glonium stellatum TaxID=574774 RepID=A0A8E2EZZ8_9PEZI|nr:hypothetical protein AOQ84DRAFT_377249 [Glonium stellatum]